DDGAAERIRQGDIYREIEYIERAEWVDGEIVVSTIAFRRVIVLTQDCDLQQDYTFRHAETNKGHDKYLLSVLVAPLHNVEDFYEGSHLRDLGRTMMVYKKQGSTANKNLKDNQVPRYHYMEFPDEIPIVSSVIDFKHYFSVPVEYLMKIKEEKFVCKVSELYREDISHRFASYLSRIGLP
ncbi:MAG: hypothetical protein HQK60_12135, partial [Deltaproteobacteria bacterium]|nr:hypothetical protein [Deltaproteobacteria bacterium]